MQVILDVDPLSVASRCSVTSPRLFPKPLIVNRQAVKTLKLETVTSRVGLAKIAYSAKMPSTMWTTCIVRHRISPIMLDDLARC